MISKISKFGAWIQSRIFDFGYGKWNIRPIVLGVLIYKLEYQIMSINQKGYSSMVELLEDKFYRDNQYYHALKDAHTAIDMYVLQNKVRQMSQERKKQ